MDWDSAFDKILFTNPGADDEQLHTFARHWNIALRDEEIQLVKDQQRNPFPTHSPLYSQYKPLDTAQWTFPQKPLPDSYLNLLGWANGGEYQTGERMFQFFRMDELREMNLVYEVLHYMLGALSFGMDGGGRHYLFDMRSDLVNGEYPILLADSGNLDYSDAQHVADSLWELCIRGEELD
ncbi:SMI1/KNR4 family protein [Paenibacillus sp. WLX1005]|uniref:SMI1/KNR4 family protein n=1 Tax=Paenibacillus sp. WLX1005 TaxID=3243766 RepID=UPI003984164F